MHSSTRSSTPLSRGECCCCCCCCRCRRRSCVNGASCSTWLAEEEGQLAAALESREVSEKGLASAFKSRQDMEKNLADTLKGIELLREKLSGAELAQEEANSLSNIVHSDNVRLEHDVAFLKAISDETQKELHSTRGVFAGERARAFQLQLCDLLKSRLECPDFLQKLECAQASVMQNTVEEGNSWDLVSENDLWEGVDSDQEDYVLVRQEDIVEGIACQV